MAEIPGAYKRVNKDDLRAMLDSGRWSRENEKMVLQFRDHIIVEALKSGKHVIVDDTNLALKHEGRLRQLATENGAAFEVV
ncbi:MAG: AAA family ATPase, partial [Acidobacteriota bacterium]